VDWRAAQSRGCSINSRTEDTHMNNDTNLMVRFVQALLAVTATGATVIVLQLALVG